MKTIKIIGLTALVFWASSCKDFEDMQIDPNRPTQTHPGLLLTNIEAKTFEVVDVGSMLASRMMVFTDGADDSQYYGWQRAEFTDRYGYLRQITKMEQEAERLEIPNYLYLALFLKSVNILEVTKTFGDVPYSDAVKAEEGVYQPAYDSQEDIYVKVLEDLRAANLGLNADGGVITGDVIYGGDITKWKKLINSFTLRVLMSLSEKEGNARLDVENSFSEIVNDPDQFPIMESNDDNAALIFRDLLDNRYPYFNNNSFKTAYYMEESFVDMLKDKEDPRLFVYADRTPLAVDADLSETDFDAYGGLGGSAPLSENATRLVAGEASRTDSHYFESAAGEPSLLMSYAEVEFTLAEAAARGWIADDAEEHYNNGIAASFDFHDIGNVGGYLDNPGVAYVPEDGIEMIITQKYISFFLNGGWEPFWNHLRTGFPAFSVDGGGILNDGLVPKRWMYPFRESQYNQANVEAALQRQFNGVDDRNGEMWLFQTE